MSNFKTYYAVCIITCVVILSIAGFFNYIVDPANLFPKPNYDKGIAEILNKGNNVAIENNYDERATQKYIIELNNNKPNVVVFGSSRTMLIKNFFDLEKTFYNYSVSGSTFNDYVAIEEMFIKKYLSYPEVAFVSLDPWLLNINNGQSRWQSLFPLYLKGALRLNSLSFPSDIFRYFIYSFDRLNKLTELISLPYLRASYENWRGKGLNEKNGYYPTDLSGSSAQIKMVDGSISYPKKYRERNLEEINKVAFEYLNEDPVYGLGKFDNLDSSYQKLFEAFVGDLIKNKVKVILLLPSYHPIVYSFINKEPKYSMVDQAENYFKEYAKKNNVLLIGSYNPKLCDFTESDFYDGMHLKQESLKKYLIEKVGNF